MRTSVRDNFILEIQNFSLIKLINELISYDSIPDYYEEKFRIDPIINERDRSVSNLISQ